MWVTVHALLLLGYLALCCLLPPTSMQPFNAAPHARLTPVPNFSLASVLYPSTLQPLTRRWMPFCATTARASRSCWTMCATHTTPPSRWGGLGSLQVCCGKNLFVLTAWCFLQEAVIFMVSEAGWGSGYEGV